MSKPEEHNHDPDPKKEGFFKSLMVTIGDKFSFIRPSSSGLSVQATGLSDRDLHAAVNAALREIHTDCYCWIVAIFQDAVVYERGYDGKLYERAYTVSATGTVAISSDEKQVRPVTQFVPVDITINSLQPQEDSMTTPSPLKSKVDKLIANSKGKFTEEDRAGLEGMSEPMLDKILSTFEEPAAPAGDTAPSAPDAPELTPAPVSAANTAPKTVADFIKDAPAEIRSVLEEGIRLQAAKKSQLIAGLRASNRCDFSDAELQAMDVAQLEKLAKLSNIATYEGARPAPLSTANSSGADQGEFTPAPMVFEPTK